MIHFNQRLLTLHFPCEEHPRQLACQLLEPGETGSQATLTTEQVRDLFSDGQAEDQAGHVESDEEENHLEDPENPANMEAENLLQPQAQEMDMGLMGDAADDATLMQGLEEEIGPDPGNLDIPYGYHEQVADEMADLEVVEELFYTPPSKNPSPPEDAFPKSASSGSSKDSKGCSVGFKTTPLEVQTSLPPRPGLKLQRRVNKKSVDCGGWQAWIDLSLPSRWFSWGGVAALYADQDQALQAAINWLWEQDALLKG